MTSPSLPLLRHCVVLAPLLALACAGGSATVTEEGPDSGQSSPDAGSPFASGSTPDAGGELASRCTAGDEAQRPGWKLAWCDEFSGPDIDKRNWSFDIGDGAFLPSGPGWGNQEKEFYTARAANARVENGALVLSALKDGPHHANGPAYPSTYDYSSARLHSKGKVDFRYGRVEVKARVPEGQGVWPAIWMLPSEGEYGGWAASGEIDIMELKGQEPDVVLGTLHFGNMWNKNSFVGCSLRKASGKYSSSFHVFAVEWEPEVIRWYIDETLYATQVPRGAPKPARLCQDASGVATTPNINQNVTDATAGWFSVASDPPAPFDRNFHILLNIAVGGEFVGAVDPGVFPQSMLVDYVRVYQR